MIGFFATGGGLLTLVGRYLWGVIKSITEAFDRTWLEIVATSVTVEQENVTSPVELSFRTTQELLVEKDTFIVNLQGSSMVIWHDYLIGAYGKGRTCGLFLWNLRENTTLYFEVCRSFFLSLGDLNLDWPTDKICADRYQSS